MNNLTIILRKTSNKIYIFEGCSRMKSYEIFIYIENFIAFHS